MKQSSFLISGSVLGADWMNFGNAFAVAEKAGVDMFQIDIADGHFAPTITYGEELLRASRAITNLPIEVHLMVSNPESWICRIAELGADVIIFHVEVVNRLQATIEMARKAGVGVGLALNSETRVEELEYVLRYVDIVTLMAILPGFSRQPFIPETYEKAARLKAMIQKLPLPGPLIEIDGGIKESNIAEVIRSGADVVVASSLIYESPSPAAAVESLRQAGGLAQNREGIGHFLTNIRARSAARTPVKRTPVTAH